MTPVEIRDALARGMNFDAVMARHASDIQKEQGIDMGLSMARARTDVQNIQNARDEGIDPPQIASPAAPTIGAQSRALDPLMTALTYNPPTAAVAPIKTGTPIGSMGLQGSLPPVDLQQQALMDMPTGDVPLTSLQKLRQDLLMAQLRQEPSIQAAFQTQADMPSEIARFARAVQPSVPVDQVAKLQGMRPSALRDINLEAVRNLPNLSLFATDPNEAARFARIAGGEAPLDANEEARFVRAAQSAAQTTGQSIANVTQPVSDFSDFEGIATPSFAEQAAQPTAGIDPNELARFARAGQPMDTGLSADQAANLAANEASLRQATRLAGLDPSEVGRFARAGQPPLSQVQDELDRFERERARVERTAGTSFDPVELFPTGDPYENIFSRMGGGLSNFYNQLRTGAGDKTEIKINQARLNFINANQDLATSDPYEYLKKLKEFEDALTDTTSYADKQNELARFKAKAQQTNAAADIAKVTEKEKEVKESKAKADANTIISDAGGVVDFSEFEGLAQPRTGTFYKPENETQLKAAKDAGIIPKDKTLKEAQDDADTLLKSTVVPQPTITPPPAATPPAATPPAATPPVGTPPVGTPPVGTPPVGTNVIGGGGFAPTPAATLAGLGELGGVLGDRSQYVQSMLTPEQQLLRYASFLPTTALTPDMEEYMTDIALPQMEAAFYAQGGDLPDSPYAATAGSPYSAFENFMRTGGRLDPAAFQEYLGEVSGALQASDPTQRQQFLSSMYASPEEQLQLLYQGMGAGTSAATRGALGRMLGRQYRQQQFDAPASAFLPSALARGGIGGAFSQYVTPQGTVATAAQPPAMSTIMANQGIIPATSGAIDMDAANAAMTMNTGAMPPVPPTPPVVPAATPPVVPMAATPAIAPTPVMPQSVQSTMPKVNRPQGMSVAFSGEGGGFIDPTTYYMTEEQKKAYDAKQREGLTPRYDITGTNIIGYDALGKGQAIRTEIDKQGNQTNMIVNDPNLVSGTTKKKKKKKKDDETTVTIPPMTMPALVSQGELLF